MSNNLFPKSAPQEAAPEKPAADSVASRLFPKSGGESPTQGDESANDEPAKVEPTRDERASKMFPKVAELEEAVRKSAEQKETDLVASLELHPVSPESLLTAVESLEGLDFPVDQEAAEQAAEILGDMDLDLTTGQQSTLVKAAAKHVERVLDQADEARMDRFESTIRGWEADVTASSHGGRDVAAARDFITEFDSGDLKNFLNDSGLGSFPGLITALARAQRELAELRGSRS